MFGLAISFSFKAGHTVKRFFATTISLVIFNLAALHILHAQDDQAAEAKKRAEIAVSAMGGVAWAAVGAVTTTVTAGNQVVPSRQYTLSIDWSGKNLQTRKDYESGEEQTTELTVGLGRYMKSTKGVKVLPPDVDLASILPSAPALALRIGLSRSKCQFREMDGTQHLLRQEAGSLEMLCSSPGTADGKVRILWWFTPDGMPAKAQIFTSSPNLSSPRFKTFEYLNFENVQGLKVPTSVTEVDGAIHRQYAFSNTSFAQSLPASLFSLK